MVLINRIFKRSFDIILALIWMVIGSPIIAGIAFLLWIESPGKIIFSQDRLGYRGRVFRLHKFRKFPAHWKDKGPGLTASDDARMTRLGAFLQKTKLDELPQLWNILKGEMSFVGPRPESLVFSDLFEGKYRKVLEFIPGIFGPNQVLFRNEANLYPADEPPEAYYRRELFPKKAEKDLDYFPQANLFSDFIWIARGFWTSIVGVIDWERFLYLHSRILFTDILLICLGWFLANIIRFSGIPREGPNFQGMLNGFWLIPLALISGMLLGGCYRHPVSYFSFDDAIRLLKVVPTACLVAFLLLLGFVNRGLSFYLVPQMCLLIVPLLAAPRIVRRIQWERIDRNGERSGKSHKVLVYGAGRGGAALANWIKTTSNGLSCVGFLDDDPDLAGRVVSGYKVLGRESDVPTIHAVYDVDEIWMTFRPGEIKRHRFQKVCEDLNIKLVVFPEIEPFSKLFHDDRKGPNAN
ncbi:MAG: sugar transferase [Thermodesulfobacteriota bacterium]